MRDPARVGKEVGEVRWRIFVSIVVGLTLALSSVATGAAVASWAPFGEAGWRSASGNGSDFGLVTRSRTLPSGVIPFGGAQLLNGPSDPTSISALSFDFKADQSGSSGGSPRLVVRFSDGGRGELRPLTWTANTWSTVDGFVGNNWDNNGGTCGFLFATTWSAILACHAGQTVTSIFVVNDSGWLYLAGEEVILDNVDVDGIVATGPGNRG